MKKLGKILGLLVDVVDSLIFSIALPVLKQFTDDKVYPYFAEKWDIGRKK